MRLGEGGGVSSTARCKCKPVACMGCSCFTHLNVKEEGQTQKERDEEGGTSMDDEHNEG